MSILIVSQTKCVKCGICCEVCPSKVLELRENGPEMLCAERCIACGHCVAVCPHDAIDNQKNPLSEQLLVGKFPVLDPQTAATFLRSRRSVRCYKQKEVVPETLLKLLDIARFAPTAGNSQGLSYIIINSPEVLRRITAVTIDWMEEQYQAGSELALRYERYVRVHRETGKDVILRNAPSLLMAVAGEDFPYGRENTCYSLAYVELYATALGLGTCWMGFVERCAMSKYPPLMELLNLPAGKRVTGAVVAGYPKYTFKRLADRSPLSATWCLPKV